MDKPPSLVSYLVVVFLLLVAAHFYLGQPTPREIAYSDFRNLVAAGRVKEVTVADEQITGLADLSDLPVAKAAAPSAAPTAVPAPMAVPAPTTRPGPGSAPPPPIVAAQSEFAVVRIADPNLVSDLLAAHVKFAGEAERKWIWSLVSWVAPLVLLFVFWSVFMRQAASSRWGGTMDIGKSKAKVYVQRNMDVKFADVEGIDEAKQELEEIVDFLKTPERYRRLGGKIPKGVLIVGAPGTGKTLLAKALAGEAEVPFLSLSGSEFVEMFVGVGAARVRDLFQQAEKLAPCIVFIDELDALGKARGLSRVAGNDEREQTLNQLLVQMDGFDTRSGVIILAATNRPEILDAALLRPGRFDRHIAIDRPDIVGREKILKVHARKLTLAPDVDLAVVAAKTPGCVGADLANIANEAALHAARHDRPSVTMRDFEEAIDRVQTGLEKKGRVMSLMEKETIAHHEAGHALIAESRATADKVSKISIIPRGIGALGFTQQLPTQDRYLLKYRELLDRLDVLLGGRVAEELTYGQVSTGAQNDLERATEIARSMVAQYGMSALLGPATLQIPAKNPLLVAVEEAPAAGCSDKTAQAIDEEVRRLLRESEERVRTTLGDRRLALEKVAAALIERETLERSALLALLAQEERAPVESREGSRAAAA